MILRKTVIIFISSNYKIIITTYFKMIYRNCLRMWVIQNKFFNSVMSIFMVFTKVDHIWVGSSSGYWVSIGCEGVVLFTI